MKSSVEVPPTVDLIKVLHVLENVSEHHSGKHTVGVDLLLIGAASFDPVDQDFINPQNFLSVFEDDKALVLQSRCAQFSTTWKRIVNLLNGVANTGVVELGDVQLAVHLAEKKSSGQPFFRSGKNNIR
ncbi:hypothetical protein OROGR_004631 [Orobanche gracilis]